jgi:hypothetical protein
LSRSVFAQQRAWLGGGVLIWNSAKIVAERAKPDSKSLCKLTGTSRFPRLTHPSRNSADSEATIRQLDSAKHCAWGLARMVQSSLTARAAISTAAPMSAPAIGGNSVLSMDVPSVAFADRNAPASMKTASRMGCGRHFGSSIMPSFYRQVQLAREFSHSCATSVEIAPQRTNTHEKPPGRPIMPRRTKPTPELVSGIRCSCRHSSDRPQAGGRSRACGRASGIARHAYKIADAMMARRKAEGSS